MKIRSSLITNTIILCLFLGTVALFSVGCSDDNSGNETPGGGTEEGDVPAGGEDSGGDGGSSIDRDIGDNNPDLMIAIGDSVTAGSETPGPGYPERLAGLIGKTVRNSGRRGAFSSSAGGHAAGALGSKPAYLLIMYGTNDTLQEIAPSVVAGNIRAAVRAAKANKTIPVVASFPPVLRSDFLKDFSQSVNQAIRSMANSEGAIFVDAAREFSGPGLYNDDLFHPNDTGNQAIAFAFANRLP